MSYQSEATEMDIEDVKKWERIFDQTIANFKEADEFSRGKSRYP